MKQFHIQLELLYRKSFDFVKNNPGLMTSDIPSNLLNVWYSDSQIAISKHEQLYFPIAIFNLAYNAYNTGLDVSAEMKIKRFETFLGLLALEKQSREGILNLEPINLFYFEGYDIPMIDGLSRMYRDSYSAKDHVYKKIKRSFIEQLHIK